MKKLLVGALIFGLTQLSVHANIATVQTEEALELIGQAQVLDKTLGLNWTRNANIAKTLCNENHPLWQSFDPLTVENGSGRSREMICEQGGVMNWHEAKAWVDHLNAHAFLGYSNWRLPQAKENDPTCSYALEDAQNQQLIGFGFGCQQSELGHLLHVSLGNPVNGDHQCIHDCITYTGPFENVRENMYWSETEIASDPSVVSVFDFSGDWQDWSDKDSDLLHVWPVHSM